MTDGFAIAMFGALFAVMNPFVNLPVFLGLTDGQSAAERRSEAIKVITYTIVMCAIVAAAGAAILKFFGITTDEFRVAGGLVLGQIGLHMLNGNESGAHHGSDAEKQAQTALPSIAFYPMTFPMLVGPGTITTLVVWVHKVENMRDAIAYGLVVTLVIALLGVVLFFSGAIGNYLNQTMRVIMTRIMGMILMAIAVQMMFAGLKALLPGLA